MDFFQKLLWDIGEQLELPLHVDENQNCKLIIEEKMALQLAISICGEFVIAAIFIAEIPAGPFRVKVLEKALSFNNEYTQAGFFSYNKRYNALVLEAFFPKFSATEEALTPQLEAMAERGLIWHNAVISGNLNTVS